MAAPWSGIAGDPAPTDQVFVAVVRLPHGEEPFMREAFEESSLAMNATSPALFAATAVESVPDSDVETALRTLGAWDERLVV